MAITHDVFLSLGRRNAGNNMTDAIALQAEQIVITTNKLAPTFPIPASGFITGESQNIGIDLGMATKSMSLSGVITEQTINKTHTASVTMGAIEVAQLIHSFVDSSALQKDQNLDELTILYPSKVSETGAMATGDAAYAQRGSDVDIPFTWKTREADNSGNLLNATLGSQFPEDSTSSGLSGVVKSFSTTIVGGSPFVEFTLEFEIATVIG